MPVSQTAKKNDRVQDKRITVNFVDHLPGNFDPINHPVRISLNGLDIL
jgi:hypothetical protein